MELITYSDADMALTEALECDPLVMGELGGPQPRAEVPKIHRRRLDSNTNGDWWLKIVPDAGGPAVGTIGIWKSTWEDEEIHEAGWMLLPAYQGRGLASMALGLLLARARSEPRIEAVHAFPGASNAASNALCRKFGFSLLETSEVDYSGRKLTCNHWRLVLDLA